MTRNTRFVASQVAWAGMFFTVLMPPGLSPARAEPPVDPPVHARGGPGFSPGPSTPFLPPQFRALLEAMKVAVGDELLSSFNYPPLPQGSEGGALLGDNLWVGALRPQRPTSLDSTFTVSLTVTSGETLGFLTITPNTEGGRIGTKMVLSRGGVVWTLDQELFLEDDVLRSFGRLLSEDLSSGQPIFDGRGGWHAPYDGGGGMVIDEASDPGFEDEATDMTAETQQCPAWDCGVFVAIMIVAVVVVIGICLLGRWLGWWTCAADWLKERVWQPLRGVFSPTMSMKGVRYA